jgi:hypothetical protein
MSDNTLLKPKRIMSEKQKEALKKGREKRHQLMRTNVQVVEDIETVYTPPPQEITHIEEDIKDDIDEDLNMTKEIKRKEHEMRMKELELKMTKLENDYSTPKKEPVENKEPEFIFRNNRSTRHFL